MGLHTHKAKTPLQNFVRFGKVCDEFIGWTRPSGELVAQGVARTRRCVDGSPKDLEKTHEQVQGMGTNDLGSDFEKTEETMSTAQRLLDEILLETAEQ